MHADVDVELMLEEGARVLERALDEVDRTADQEQVLVDAIRVLRDPARPPVVRLKAGTDAAVEDELGARPLRDMVSPSPEYHLLVERERALYGAWYEFFPRSRGRARTTRTGKLAAGHASAPPPSGSPPSPTMGFDVIYLPPIHPIGEARTARARTTPSTPGPDDPGSPVGDRLARTAGTTPSTPTSARFDDFDAFVARGRASSASRSRSTSRCRPPPTTRGSTDHPEWFTTRADGTIAYAENPPKKYQDIYPINFDNDPDGIYAEVLRDRAALDRPRRARSSASTTRTPSRWSSGSGCSTRSDATDPDVLFLAEAFTKPAMMHALGDGRLPPDLHVLHLAQHQGGARGVPHASSPRETAAYMRPNFFVNTPDILHAYLQYGGPAAFKIRAVLAATLVARPGASTPATSCSSTWP